MLTLNDGRSELWQWDTGRKLTVDTDCSQVHFSNKVFGRSIDVDVVDGVAIIPDTLLQSDKELCVWAFVGTPENGYTKISKVFKVNKRNKPADYVFTPLEQTTLQELVERLAAIEESQDPDAIKNAVEDYLEQNPVEAPVQSVNGKTGGVKLTAEDVGAISQDKLQEATSEALAQAKASGEFDGLDGKSAYQIAVDNGFEGSEAEWLESLKGGGGGTSVSDAVLYTEQELTEEQKAQARRNIGATRATMYVATDYGISTDSEDNTPALQELVDAVSEAGGGTIFFPVGTYNFSYSNLKSKYETHVFSVLMKPNVSIVGENIETTVLKQTSGIPYSLFYHMGEADAPITGCSFSNFTVDAYDTGNRNAVHGKAFFFQYVQDCVFRDLRLLGTVATAMGIDFLNRVVIDNVSCIDCGRTFTGSEAGTSGIGIGTCGMEHENFVITNCICSGCGQYGIFIENQGLFGDGNVNYAKGCVISNCIVRNGLNKGIGIRGGENVTVIGCETYENATHGIYIDNNCKNIKVTSCSSANNDGDGICIEPNPVSDGIIVKGCVFVGNNGNGVSVTKQANGLNLSENYTDKNAIGVEIADCLLPDCVIYNNAFMDGEQIQASFYGNKKHNDFAEVDDPTGVVEITEGLYSVGYKFDSNGYEQPYPFGGAYATFAYIDVSALGESFVFKFGETVGDGLRVVQYYANKKLIENEYGIPYVKNTKEITITKLDGCKYIRLFSSTCPTIGVLENIKEAQSVITAESYSSGYGLYADGTTYEVAGGYTTLDYIDISGFSDRILFDFTGSASGVDKGTGLRIAQYDDNKVCLTAPPKMIDVSLLNHVMVVKHEGCKYIRIHSSTYPTVGELKNAPVSDCYNVEESDYTEGYKIAPDGAIVAEQGAYSTLDYIDVGNLANVFYLYYGDSDASNVGNALRVAQYDANYIGLSDSFSWHTDISGKTNIAIEKLEGCQFIRIFSSTRPTVCQLLSTLQE